MAIEFTKLHGLGNDYLFIDGEKYAVADPAELSRRMSHRHLGAGSDGIILVLPGESGDFRMRIFNADGSEAETCGNGIRCFAKYVYERGMTHKTDFVIDTLAGPNRVRLNVRDGNVLTVRSNMGKPKFERAEIPMIGPPGRVIEEPLDLGDCQVKVTCANVGNPHAVVFVDDATAVNLAEIGPKIENHPAFPQRTNVEFVSVIDHASIVMRIWERGSGITMASGSGSCGSALASMITGRVDRRVDVRLVYGALTIEWADDGCVYQEGPATEVYSGLWPE
ncbi:MAG TPA: diaminopimelate epimerase [Candidatus Hydrogenedentes bacterium]|nr:diaminopimelate epimerase [Candidatus Hydrogenedentota bacterium]